MLALLSVGAAAQASASPLAGVSTLEQRLSGDEPAEYSTLTTVAGEPYQVREEFATAGAGRAGVRDSLLYFGQLSDFQLADEESPARVEFFDGQPGVNFSSSGHRPQETLTAHQVEAAIRQMNAFSDESPVPQGDGTRAAMDNVIATGDLADSMQLNETLWVRTLLEGGTLNPGSGAPTGDPICNLLGLTPLAADFADPSRYTGVQDYDDYLESLLFWDPDNPIGPYAAWPTYPGMVDKAQEPFEAQGLDVPSYVALGNHDVLVQGNEDANLAFELVATGCIKPMGPFLPNDLATILDPTYLLGLLATDPTKTVIAPPDPNRQYVTKQQQRAIFAGGAQTGGVPDDDHGFAYVDQAELDASGGSAAYYSFSPEPGIRFIALDTNTTGAGLLVDPITQDTTAEGNIDDPQFQWLRSELEEAEANDELVVTYAHHASNSMDFSLPDELALPCLGINDAHGHDINPGCDPDPRTSLPIHNGSDLVSLLGSFPNVIAHVAGHSHNSDVIPRPSPSGGFWEIKSPAIADWPTQARLLEVMDNNDGTLSIFGTMIDHDSPADAPDDGADLSGADVEELASLGREISFNDEQVSHTEEGAAEDRNVELLLPDPRGEANDTDNDGVENDADNCPTVENANQNDLDDDDIGDACDDDIDGDGLANVDETADGCPAGSDSLDSDSDDDGTSDGDDAFPCNAAESADGDGDGAGDNSDNCPTTANADQADGDNDGVGDACEADAGGGGSGGGGATDGPSGGGAGEDCANRVGGTGGDDRLAGTTGADELRGLGGADRLRGGAGDDCLRGGKGPDRLNGGAGADQIRGGSGGDQVKAADGERDSVRCGRGADAVVADPKDRLRGCERVRRRG